MTRGGGHGLGPREMPGAEAGARRPTASERRRMYRDLALSLRCGLRDAAAGLSFLRLRGLRALLRALRSADADLGLFRDSQAIRDLQGLNNCLVISSSRMLLSSRLCLPFSAGPIVGHACVRAELT